VFSASDINDTNGTLNLATGAQWAAAKNKIINGDFRFNQRTFTSTTTSGTYGFDRFWLQRGAGGTVTYSAQTFTAGTAPVAGYEAINFARLVTVSQSATTDYAVLRQSIEDVRTFANQTVTVSAWIKAGTNGQLANFGLAQNFGGGGSGEVYTKGANLTLTTSWARYSTTFTVPSIAGKTIGTSSSLNADIWTSGGSAISAYTGIGNQNATIDMWGLQVEQGSTATAFQTASGSIGGELALCQRYYLSWVTGTTQTIGIGTYTGGGTAVTTANFPVTMRIQPTLVVATGTNYYRFNRVSADDDFNSFTIFNASFQAMGFYNASEVSGTSGTSGYMYTNNASASIAFNAEL
jgi:hypothetical protein